MSTFPITEHPATTGNSPAEGGIRTPDPRITNGGGRGLEGRNLLGEAGVGNTRGEHPGLRLLEMPRLEGMEVKTLSDFMGLRREEEIAKIVDRVKRIQAANGDAGFSLGDLKSMLRDAFVAGGRAMCDGLAARESAASLERLEAMEREVERAQIRMGLRRGFPEMAVLPWPETGSLMDQVKAASNEGGAA